LAVFLTKNDDKFIQGSNFYRDLNFQYIFFRKSAECLTSYKNGVYHI